MPASADRELVPFCVACACARARAAVARGEVDLDVPASPEDYFNGHVERLEEMAEALAPDKSGPEKASRVAERFGHDYVQELKAEGIWQAFCDRLEWKVTRDDLDEMKSNGSWEMLERQHERTQADHEAHVRSLTRHTMPTRRTRPRARGAGRPGRRSSVRCRAGPGDSDPHLDGEPPSRPPLPEGVAA